jgi:type III pantothenate kinase
MDINLLVISAGNTRTAVAVFVAGELQKVLRVPSAHLEETSAAIAELWPVIANLAFPGVAGVCVNPPLREKLEFVVEQQTGQELMWVGEDIEYPIDVRTENPKATGPDRVVNVAAAYEQLEKACVVVDAGTALTVSVCDDDGRFLGGAIAPGAAMQLATLHARIPHLPEPKLQVPSTPIGTDTAQAIQSGVYHGIRGLVKELLETYAMELGGWPELIVTGGDAETLFGGWELTHAIVPDLTLYGIALAYTEHHIALQNPTEPPHPS